MSFSRSFRYGAFFTATLMAFSVSAEPVLLRAGTPLFGKLDEEVKSKKKLFSEGDLVKARVWMDVRADDQIVIRAGTPMTVRVSKLKTSKIFGVKGKLELEAVSVDDIEGNEIILEGGYDKSGRGRKGWAIGGFLVLAWPLMFLQGKDAVLESGTIFDCTVEADRSVEVLTRTIPKITLKTGPRISATILYDEGKDDILPMELRVCEIIVAGASIVSVNGVEIEPIDLELGENVVDGDCETIQARVSLKKLGKHFKRGINTFEIQAAGKTVELILEVEL